MRFLKGEEKEKNVVRRRGKKKDKWSESFGDKDSVGRFTGLESRPAEVQAEWHGH